MKLMDIFRTQGRLWAWLYEPGKGVNNFLECSFSPRIYVGALFRELCSLQRVLKGYGVKTRFETRRTLQDDKLTVLTVWSSVKGVHSLIRDLEEFSEYSYELYNADIPLEEYYLFSQDVFPYAEVKVQKKGNCIVCMQAKDTPREEYSLPKLRKAFLSLETSPPLRRGFDAELFSITFARRRFEGKNFIRKFVRCYEQVDCDILETGDGELELPYLLQKIREQYPDFSFSRLGRDLFKTAGGSYTSYGRTIYKYRGISLKGRLHFRRKGVLYGYWNLWYPFELARTCRVTLQRINHRSVGYGVSNLQLYHALKQGYIIPRTRSFVEEWKSGQELFNADRGALIYEPKVGYHENTAEIDFVSLFPNIMVRYNISTETLFCSCCPDNVVPGLEINVCRKKRGMVPEILDPIIRQRLFYKSTGKEEHKYRADALKAILVTSFGYMGYKKSKLARIEAHQSIQAYARETLVRASRIAEEQGFEVVHGIVDSLWVKKAGISKEEVYGLIHAISAELGIEINFEGIYRWIVFLPSTTNKALAVPTRYYGVFESGEVKCRGIELRKHDTPLLIKRMQKRMIEKLAKACSFKEFKEQMKYCSQELCTTISRIRQGYVDRGELLITKNISRTKYRSNAPQAIAVKKMQQRGYDPQPGHFVSYLIADKDNKRAEHRYALAEENADYDRNAYIKLARKAALHMFMAFDFEERQTRLNDYDYPGIKIKGLPVQITQGLM